MKHFWRYSLDETKRQALLFFGLLFLSMAFFVSASDDLSGKNIFDDPDHDGLTSAEEQLYGTNPNVADTDGDGYSDGVEVRGGYDPLKPSPGDKIIPDTTAAADAAAPATNSENLTIKTSKEIANLVQDANANPTENGTAEMSVEQLNEAAQNILSGSQDEIALPEVDVASIKIKKQSYGKLSASKKKAAIKKDVQEYVTVMTYIFANNSPKKVTNEDDLRSFSDEASNNIIAALSSGNISYLESLAKNGDNILKQVEDVEVPPQLLDTHIKAIKLAMYAASLKDQLNIDPSEDPMRMITSLSKTQGLLAILLSFTTDVQQKLDDYEITDIPLDF